MGCCESTPDKAVQNGATHTQQARRSSMAEIMSNEEIQKRIDSIDETRKAKFGGFTVRYAYVSQRGYYPDDANKPNQDAYAVEHDFCGEKSDAFFGVFDGHGRDGDKCAQFASENLHELVSKYINKLKSREMKLRRKQDDDDKMQQPIELTKEQIQSACTKAHLECNHNMHRSNDLDDSLSGTTSISAYFHGRRNRITVCNVGDSRAIVGSKLVSKDGHSENTNGVSTLRAQPLSRDQTPYRTDERMRVKKAGARVLSLDQIEGLEPIPDDDEDENSDNDLVLGEELDEGGDPPRIWSPHGEYPGTAFSRSIGDAIAEELGVTAEPEMLTREITPEDKIIVIASDGVFEFLTNQSVIDICTNYTDPLEACRAVVAESYELWLQYELRTDDITMICIFIDETVQKPSIRFDSSSKRSLQPDKSEETSDTADDFVPTEGLRPVRTGLSKEKSKALKTMRENFDSEANAEANDFDITSLITEKSDDEKARIAEAIRASVMFKDITNEQRELIYGVMEPISVKKGTWVIKQGTVGDRFYIVDTGVFEVRIVPEGEEDKEGNGGNVVHVYAGSREKHAHPSFGELALMYSAPRAASIIAQTDGQLWALHRYAFRQILDKQSERKQLVRTLQKINLFKSLDKEKIKDLAAAMKEVTFDAGQTIIEQNAVGDTLYVVMTGTCEYIEKDGTEITNATLKKNDFFGEEVIVDERRYAATVIALQTTCCLQLDKETVKQTVANLKLKKKVSKNSNVA